MNNLYHQLMLIAITGSLVYTVSTTAPYDVEAVEFYSNNTRLSGTVVFPEGPVHAAVAFVHGSGRQRRNLTLARRFASEGIAALVYDKRGVGQSEGIYVQSDGSFGESDLDLLSDDAVAALEVLLNHDKLQEIPVGLAGVSQAGWIIPLAAEKSPAVAFMAIWSGPVCKLSEEDIFSKYTSNRDFRGVPGYEQVRSMREEPYKWPADLLGDDVDSGKSLSRLEIPGLWIFGTEDGSIPVDLSISNLTQLADEGRSAYEYALFSNTGHATIDKTFLTMTGWITRTAASADVTHRSTTLTSRELDQYVGTYSSMDPSIEVTFTKRGIILVATMKGESLDFEYTGDHSFRTHDYGNGYIFLDFYPAEGSVIASEHGRKYTLYKQ